MSVQFILFITKNIQIDSFKTKTQKKLETNPT